MEYKPRIIDDQLDLKLESFGATLIVGPKGCGKTTSAKQKAKSYIEFQDEDVRENLLSVAADSPSKLLLGEKPRLFDEWQDAPKLWGAIRKSVDDLGENGLYILTGSSSKDIAKPHTGTSRISQLKMYPMSLYESGESNGTVSLLDLFNEGETFDGCQSSLSIDGLIFALCRGGWPKSLMNKTERSQLEVAKDIYRQTYSVDISNIDGKNRNARLTEAILQSYSRNICTTAKTKTIYDDVNANFDVSRTTLDDYIEALEKLYIIDEIEAWRPAIRSRSAIRSSKKRNFIDPSIAVAALGLSPAYFDTDFKTLGFLFESLCIRDLKIYSAKFDGRIGYYRDRYGLKADCALHLNDGRYALIEFKIGSSQIDEAASHLIKIEGLIKQHNEKERQCPIRLPDLKIVITGSEYGYRRKDGVFVIPIGCLKD
ncbi:MAG: ATP-binding protein [Firmicutes bacterium]|uniref:ATP-binding protein n=1 Tax=Candidatus Alloenteromonas pullistercoris TaxID=2840785 RepID=A0A9D9GTM4_9FIRM|nr:ATP-binding protein [Candidatus Enteromonas pullistercoris]